MIKKFEVRVPGPGSMIIHAESFQIENDGSLTFKRDGEIAAIFARGAWEHVIYLQRDSFSDATKAAST